MTRVGQVWPGVTRASLDLRWAEQGQGRLPVPGPAGGGWPMSGVARVTNWSRDRSVTGAGQALSSVTPGQSRVRWHSESGAETGTRLWHSVRDTPGTGRHRDTSVTVWHSDVTRNTDNIITLESFATRTDVLEFYKSFFWLRNNNTTKFHANMELLLRTSFDIPKPPGGGLFDREYPHFAARQIFYWSCQLGAEREKRLFWIRGTSSSQRSFELGQQWSIELLRYISFKISSLDRCSKLNMETGGGFYFMLHYNW